MVVAVMSPPIKLTRRTGQGENEVRRILSLGHKTKLDRLEDATKALGEILTRHHSDVHGGATKCNC